MTEDLKKSWPQIFPSMTDVW